MKQIALTVLLFLGVNTVFAQDDVPMYSSTGKPVRDGKVASRKKSGFDASRIIFGGGFGLGIGNITNVSISPIVGYRVSDRFSAGVGLGYQYVRIKNYSELFDASNNTVYKPLTASIYSPSVWMRYILWNNIFAHVEYEHNFMTQRQYRNNNSIYLGAIEEVKLRVNAPSLLVGAGIRQPVSDRVSILFQGMYDVIQDKNSPYRGTIAFRFGIVAGF